MRFTSITLAGVAVIAAFAIGRATTYPPQMAAAQTMGQPAASIPPKDGTMMPPPSFSHFKCYQTAVKLPKPAVVDLRDQFGEARMQLNYADLFCTPVQKRLLSGRPIVPPGPTDHLLCYRGETQSMTTTRVIVNQLQKAQIQVSAPRYLCVPTWKSEKPG